MLNYRALLWVTLLLCVCAGPSTARTWYVEQDGTGEFTRIHNAVFACSAGDTIMIGPGRYDDFHPFTAPAWTTEAIVGITKDNLTLIGSGNTETIIGPTEMYLPGGVEPIALASVDDVDVTIVNIGFENAYNCIYWSHGRISIEGCRFEGHKNGMYIFNEGGASVIDSAFFSDESQSKGIVAFSPSGPVSISDCFFGGPVINEISISINGTQNVSVQRCYFSSFVAITFAGSSGSVDDCTTTKEVAQSVWATDASRVGLSNNKLHGTYASLSVDTWSDVTGTGNVFTGGATVATIQVSSQSHLTLNGNHILKSGDYAVKTGQYFYEIVTNDLTGNYWGTTDPDTIAEWIWDYNDDPLMRAYIDFTPFADGPVPTEATSWGSVKLMFR
jgi:hypothetical protein